MFVVDKILLKKIMTREMGYTSIEADLFLRVFPSLHKEMNEVFQAWLKDRTVLPGPIAELPIREVMAKRRCNFLVAVKEINHLLDRDMTVDRRAELIKILSRPVMIR